MYFSNRCDAGRRLAARLVPYRADQPVVLGLPGGGVPVAYEVAKALEAPLDVLVVRKLGAPGHEELAIGAVAPGVTVIDDETLELLRVPPSYVERVKAREEAEVQRRMELFSDTGEPPVLTGRAVILVDDGIATGATTLAAARAARLLGAVKIVIAAPVVSPPALDRLRGAADAVEYLAAPAGFRAVGQYYEDFTQVAPEDVRALLKRARLEREAGLHPVDPWGEGSDGGSA